MINTKKSRKAVPPMHTAESAIAREAAARAVLDGRMNQEQAAVEFGLGSVQVVKFAIQKELGYRKAAEENAIAPEMLSMSAKEKLEAAQLRQQHEFERRVDEGVRAKLKEAIDGHVLAAYQRRLDEANMIVRSRKGVMTREEYRLILSLLHPDRVADSDLKEKYNEAFYIFKARELLMCDDKELPVKAPLFPRSYDELMKMRERVKTQRKGPRDASGIVRRRN